MNCKPGDLAVIVAEEPLCLQNIGKFVTVLDRRFSDDDEWRCEALSPLVAESVVTGVYSLGHAGEILWVRDAHLRPIRDQPGEDESLTWAGLPHKQGLPA